MPISAKIIALQSLAIAALLVWNPAHLDSGRLFDIAFGCFVFGGILFMSETIVDNQAPRRIASVGPIQIPLLLTGFAAAASVFFLLWQSDTASLTIDALMAIHCSLGTVFLGKIVFRRI